MNPPHDLTRRTFFRWLLGLSCLPLVPFIISETESGPSPSKGEPRRTIGEFFKGEELSYEVGFWLFKKAALGTLTFKPAEKKGYYQAVLQAETMGILGFVARYRVDTYRSLMEEIEGGRRLRSVSFEEDVKVGDKVRRRKHQFDYQRMKWIQIRRKKDGSLVRKEEDIPAGKIYDDFLTASFNFRYGVYGEIERGRRYSVPTFPKKGSSNYEVQVAPREEEEKKRRAEKMREEKDYYVKLFLDPEVTHSKEGLIEGWLSKDLYPIEGTIRDVVLFGDVTGRLIHKVRS